MSQETYRQMKERVQKKFNAFPIGFAFSNQQFEDEMKRLNVKSPKELCSIGAGGFINKRKKIGDKVFWINMTDVSVDLGWKEEFVNKRNVQIEKIVDFYNFDGVYNLKFAPAMLDSIDKKVLIDSFSSCIKMIEPDWIVLPYPEDAHSDHCVTFEVAMSCAKIFRYPYIKRIMMMEVLSETNFPKTGEAFSPNYYIDISDSIEAKITALQIYDTEFREHPFPRSIDAINALALLRGSEAGCKYAEAFRILKWIE